MVCCTERLSWSVSLGSGTSVGTMAPLFTIGAGLGGVAGAAVSQAFPALGVDPRLAALQGQSGTVASAAK